MALDDYAIPGLGTYTAPGWDGNPEATYRPATEAMTPPSSASQVPGTSGAPQYTPSATPGGVASGSPGSSSSSPWGNLAAMLGVGTQSPQQRNMALLGYRMLAPPANPLRPGRPPPQLSATGTDPRIAQYQQMFGVDYATALQMMALLHPGGTAMTPQMQSQNIYGSGAYQASAAPPSPSAPLLPGSAMPTAAQPYTGRAPFTFGPTARLPPLGQNAYTQTAQMQPLPSQMLYGSIA